MAEPGKFTINIEEWPLDPNFHDFAAFLGLPVEKDSKGTYWPYNKKVAQKLGEIYFWGKVKSKSLDHEKIKKVVYRLKKGVGVNWIGETLVNRLWEHIQFDTAIAKDDLKVIERLEKEASKKEGKEVKMEKDKEGMPEKSKPSKTFPIKQERNVVFRIKPKEIEIKTTKRRPKEPELLE
jgi:hypothetical protein